MSAVKVSVLNDAGAAVGGIVAEAQAAVNVYLQPGLGPQGNAKAYDDTSDKYDQYMVAFDYTSPQKAAQTIGELFPEQSQREQVYVLDVAAGTGLVGVEMQKMGFKNVDALDPSQGMLDEVAKRGFYGKLYKEFIDDKKLPIEENTYDAIVISGGMGENQIPCSALHEMIRLVKPGGYIVNVTRVEHLQNCQDYVGRLEQLMERLESEGRWRAVSRTTFPNFLRGKEGLCMVHRVL